jgi:hypothetical protein
MILNLTRRKWFGLCMTALLCSLSTPSPARAAEDSITYSPYARDKYPARVFWGDTHLHTSLSTDAFGFGVRLGPEQAFRFASGETVTSTRGQQVRLSRPLDFVVVADHAESLGVMELVRRGDERIIVDELAAEWHRLLNGSAADQLEFRKRFLSRETRHLAFQKLDELATEALQKSIWKNTIGIAEHFNRPGQFTSLLGYEWTSAPGGSNLHRVVVFRDGGDRVGSILPFSSYDSEKPEDLWQYLGDYETTTGGQALAIPHNANISNGLMFPSDSSFGGSSVDRRYAETRMRWEPVVEVTQIKGDGEAHPLLSPDDEFADYETWDAGNFEGSPKTDAMLPHEYARSALRIGLQVEQSEGANPYRFGMIGSTDSHTALATAGENNFFGKHSGVEPGPDRWKNAVGKSGDRVVLGWEQAASGYAAVWATDNTREALWDALKRREVYATTGSRITVRLFGGWYFEAEDALGPELARVGYAKGVPMGGLLPAGGSGKAPGFLVAASRDPMGANLDRIQIIKGWVDAKGESHEQVYDAVWSNAERRGADDSGRLQAVGNTVDAASASWENSIGAAELATVWHDPEFDPGQRAFYYARVIEIPTPRWTAYDAARFGVTMDDKVPMVTQERAYTSPIWYTP